MDYHGGNKWEINAKRLFNLFVLGILENSLFLEDTTSSDAFKLQLINMSLSRLRITFLETNNIIRLLTIDRSRQPGNWRGKPKYS